MRVGIAEDLLFPRGVIHTVRNNIVEEDEQYRPLDPGDLENLEPK